MVDIEYARQLPEERMLLARAALNQDRVQEALQTVSAKAREFFRWRAIAVNDSEARHLMGNPREAMAADDKRSSKAANAPCDCSRRQPGWVDLREDTVRTWKKSEAFMICYSALLWEPLLLSSVRLEQLSIPAVQAYEEILSPGSEAKASVKRLAAKDVLETVGLKQTEGSNVKSSAGLNELQIRMAKERMNRGMALSGPQRQLLLDAGVKVDGEEPVGTQTVIGPGGSGRGSVERTLDGDDIVIFDDGGEDNEAYLPD